MNRTQWVAFATLILSACVSGCRSGQCNNGTGTGWSGWGNARVAPPATNSYQLPTTSQPYYAPTSIAANQGILVPSGATGSIPGGTNSNFGFQQPGSAPTNSLNPNALPALQPGWRPSDTATGSGYYGPNGLPIVGGINESNSRPLANDFQSTAVDERFDPSRMPANDATMVRAPSNFNPTGNWQMLNPIANNSPGIVPGSFEYRTSPQITGVGNMAYNTMPQPTIGYPTYTSAPQTGAVVLAQASTSPELMASDPNYQVGWRDRFNSGTYLNR